VCAASRNRGCETAEIVTATSSLGWISGLDGFWQFEIAWRLASSKWLRLAMRPCEGLAASEPAATAKPLGLVLTGHAAPLLVGVQCDFLPKLGRSLNWRVAKGERYLVDFVAHLGPPSPPCLRIPPADDVMLRP